MALIASLTSIAFSAVEVIVVEAFEHPDFGLGLLAFGTTLYTLSSAGLI